MNKIKFNYSKLLGKIIEKYGSQGSFASSMKLSERTISLKLNGERNWKDIEIKRAIELLDIPKESIHTYFFEQ